VLEAVTLSLADSSHEPDYGAVVTKEKAGDAEASSVA
jgi:hypothetical protein